MILKIISTSRVIDDKNILKINQLYNSSSSSKSDLIAALRVLDLLCDSMLVESSFMLSAILENSIHLWLCRMHTCVRIAMHIL